MFDSIKGCSGVVRILRFQPPHLHGKMLCKDNMLYQDFLFRDEYPLSRGLRVEWQRLLSSCPTSNSCNAGAAYLHCSVEVFWEDAGVLNGPQL